MVDFTRETPIDVASLALRLNVHQATVRRWFKRGLEWARIGGRVVTSLEALQRFSKIGNADEQQITAVIVDKETLAALKSLRARGFKIGQQGGTDGCQSEAAGQPAKAG